MQVGRRTNYICGFGLCLVGSGLWASIDTRYGQEERSPNKKANTAKRECYRLGSVSELLYIQIYPLADYSYNVLYNARNRV